MHDKIARARARSLALSLSLSLSLSLWIHVLGLMDVGGSLFRFVCGIPGIFGHDMGYSKLPKDIHRSTFKRRQRVMLDTADGHGWAGGVILRTWQTEDGVATAEGNTEKP